MYNRLTLGFKDAMAGMQAVLDEAKRAGDTPFVIAIVDHKGDLVVYGCLDDAPEIARNIAVRKAYASAIGTQDSADYAKRIRGILDVPLELFIGDRAVSATGGVTIPHPTMARRSIGGVAVSGAGNPARDVELSRLAVRVIQEAIGRAAQL